jgi:hypothetical protein
MKVRTRHQLVEISMKRLAPFRQLKKCEIAERLPNVSRVKDDPVVSEVFHFESSEGGHQLVRVFVLIAHHENEHKYREVLVYRIERVVSRLIEKHQ